MIKDIEQAIEDLKYAKTSVSFFGQEKSLDLAIEALERQKPKKPSIKKWSPALCPCCDALLSESLEDGYYKHWENLKVCDCGQKLIWN